MGEEAEQLDKGGGGSWDREEEGRRREEEGRRRDGEGAGRNI